MFYLPKRDIEDQITSMEFDTPEKWGGEIRLKQRRHLLHRTAKRAPARLPYSVRARRIDGVE